MDLRAMMILREVATQRSFTRAAHSLRLGITTVSDHIARLEAEYGVRLFNRTTRSVTPTAAGQAMYDLAVRVLDDVAATRRRIASGIGEEPFGLVRIRVSDGVCRELIFPHLQDFSERYPRIRLEFLQDDDLFGRARGSADIVIRDVAPFYAVERAGGTLLGMTHTGFVVSAAYAARRGVPGSLADLANHDCIGFIDPMTGRRWEWPILRNGRSDSILPTFRHSVSSPSLLKEAALAHLGIAPVLEYAVRNDVLAGRLVPVLIQNTFPHPIGILLSEGGRPWEAVTATIDFLRQTIQTECTL